MSRAAYHREYYRTHLPQSRAASRKSYAKRMQRSWAYWLLGTLEFPPEPEYVVPVPSPVRRALLRLRK